MSNPIGWCTRTWSPFTGCTPISPGCANCWAKRTANRLRGRFGYPKDEPFKVTVHEDRFDEPCKWKKPQRIFVCSMGDLFHEGVVGHYIHSIFQAMRVHNEHTFLVLTKRPERMRRIVMNCQWWAPSENAWLRVSVENQEYVAKRIPKLLDIPAAKRFVSVEPMLGPMDITPFVSGMAPVYRPGHGGGVVSRDMALDAGMPEIEGEQLPDHPGYIDFEPCESLDWVIVGCESGPKRRPCKLEWVRDVVGQCREAEVPVYVKQLDINGQVVHEINQFPNDLQIREIPE